MITRRFEKVCCRLLKDETDLIVVAMPEDGRKLSNLLKSSYRMSPLSDISMPKLNGIEAAKQIRVVHRHSILWSAPIVIHPMFWQPCVPVAAGYLLKNAPLHS
jgi:DNA-binding NarL/FixJ family response regulator